MNAATTAVSAKVVWPTARPRSRVQTISYASPDAPDRKKMKRIS